MRTGGSQKLHLRNTPAKIYQDWPCSLGRDVKKSCYGRRTTRIGGSQKLHLRNIPAKIYQDWPCCLGRDVKKSCCGLRTTRIGGSQKLTLSTLCSGVLKIDPHHARQCDITNYDIGSLFSSQCVCLVRLFSFVFVPLNYRKK